MANGNGSKPMAERVLAAVICLAFLGSAIWRAVAPGNTMVEQVNAYFNVMNYIVMALIGLGCLFWPDPKPLVNWLHRHREEEDKSPAGEVEVEVVVDATVSDSDSKRQADGKNPAVESLAQPTQTGGAPAEDLHPALPPKQQVTYLTNLKTFLTFMVVTYHAVSIFGVEALGGMNPESFVGQPVPVNTPSFTTFACFFMQVNDMYFMSAFFFVSACFCPKSLDRKGFRVFVIDKIVRLGGPFVLFTLFLQPLLQTIPGQAFYGQPIQYTLHGYGGPSMNLAVVWFILWLLNFSIVYAVLAEFVPKIEISMPHPLALLPVGLVLMGAVFLPMYLAPDSVQAYYGTGTITQWNMGIMYICFFTCGVIAGRNNWLKSIEEMRLWVVWVLRLIVVGFWVTIFLAVAKNTIPSFPGLHLNSDLALNGLIPPVYAVPMTLAIIQFFHQYFNATPQSKLAKGAGQAAYMVYVIQYLPLSWFLIAYIAILKAVGLQITPQYDTGGWTPYGTGGLIWGGFFFVLVLTQLTLWPSCFYLRKLPVLNKMF